MAQDLQLLRMTGRWIGHVGEHRLRLKPGQYLTTDTDTARRLLAARVATVVENRDDDTTTRRGQRPEPTPWPIEDDQSP